MAYSISWRAHGIVTTWSGRASSAELLRFLGEVQGDPRFDDLRYSLHDYRACEAMVFDAAEMAEVAALDCAGAASNPDIRVAIVADQACAREMEAAYLDPELSRYPLRVFADMDQACAWLGIAGED